jgi:hypothetical protein
MIGPCVKRLFISINGVWSPYSLFRAAMIYQKPERIVSLAQKVLLSLWTHVYVAASRSTSEESLRKSTHRECGDDVLPLWSSKQKLQPYFTGVNQDESNVKPRNQAVGSSRMQGSNRQRFRLRMRSPSKAKSNTGSSAASSMLSNHICSLIGVFRYKPFCYFSRSVSTPVQSGETPFTM